MSDAIEIVSLNEELRRVAQEYKSKRPAEIAERMSEAFARLDAAGVAPGLAVGEAAPDFELPDAKGKLVRLTDRLASGPVVLSFYRGAWCPYCNLELQALQAALSHIVDHGASVVAISPQAPDDAVAVVDRHDLTFDVLSDVEQQVIRDYRLQFVFPHEIRPYAFPDTAAALARQQPDGEWRLPVPATFVIDTAGIIQAKHASMNWRVRMEPADIVRALVDLKPGR